MLSREECSKRLSLSSGGGGMIWKLKITELEGQERGFIRIQQVLPVHGLTYSMGDFNM